MTIYTNAEAYEMALERARRTWTGEDDMEPLKSLSKIARDARRPFPPDVLANALQDTVHKEGGRTRPAKSARSLTAQLSAPDARFGNGK